MIQAIRPERAVDLATATIRKAILDGEYPPASFLPAERALAAVLGINRLTLRAALARLESEGLVRAEQGNGVRVLEYRAHAGLGVLLHLVDEAPLSLLGSFLELRRVLAAEAVALACERATASQLETLLALAELQENETDQLAFSRRDLAFARELVRAAQNLAMELLFNSVEQLVSARPAISRAMHHDLDAIRPSYRQVAGLIRAGDGEVARRTVRAVLALQDEATLAWLREQEGRT